MKPRFASLRTLFEPRTSSSSGEVLDSGALLLYFPGPQTVTGEDVLEFHVHGGPAIVKAVLTAIPNTILSTKDSPIVRYAEPGEFTRRAFYNDRLDLTQIEALGDTLSAETEQQRRLAVRGTNNSLTERYETWRHQLLDARGELEALIDFSEDQHFDESPMKLVASVQKQVDRLKHHIQASILNASRGELLRNGINIALLGSPNAGKSSLLNRIVGREAAIVSKEAGTTRDVVDINVDIGGFFCRFGDLAGIREPLIDDSQLPNQQAVNPIGEVEEEGIRRAKARVAAADIIILVLSIEHDLNQGIKAMISPDVLKTLANYDANRQQLITVVNKSDLIPVNQDVISTSNLQSCLQTTYLSNVLKPFNPGPLHFISCKEDSGGLPDFLSHLIQLFHKITSSVDMDGESDNSTSTMGSCNQPLSESLGASERQRLLLVDCNNHLLTFLDSVSTRRLDMEPPANEDSEEIDIVLAAESLRAAGECLAKITGKGEAGDVEEVLGVVFEKYVYHSFPSITE